MPQLDAALVADDDQVLVARVLAGDRAVFEVLVRRHNQRLYRATRAVLRDHSEAEDALQGAWLSVFRNLHNFRGDAAFSTWATRIAVNEAVTQMRKQPIIAEVVDSVDETAAVDEAYERTQLGELLERCLANLPQGNREVMVLRDVLEMDTAETALCLGLTEEAVRVRLHRARASVHALLSETFTHARDVYSFDGARCDRITAAVMKSVNSL